MVQVMREVLASAGYEAQVDFMTWAQVDQRTESGAVFGGFPLVLSESRDERMLHSDPLFSAEYVLFTRAHDPQAPRAATDLAGLRVGGVTGYDYWAELDDAANELIRFDSTADGFDALLNGDIDVFAEGLLPAQIVLADPVLAFDESYFEVVASEQSWARSLEDLRFMMPRTSEAERALERINAALAEFQASSEYAELVETLEIETHQRDQVVINSETNPVELYLDDRLVIGRTPNGTTGTVQEWPSGYREQNANPELLVRVKLDSGPFAGRIVWVNAAEVEIVQ